MGQSLPLIVFFVLISCLFVCSSQWIHGSEFAINCIFCVNFLFVCLSQPVCIFMGQSLPLIVFFVLISCLFVCPSQYIHGSEFAINCIFCVNFPFVCLFQPVYSWVSLPLIVFFVLISCLFVCPSQYIHGSEFAINCIFCVNFLFVCLSQPVDSWVRVCH